MIYPLRIYKGREDFFISLSYLVDAKSETRCQGWGVVNSNTMFSLGDRFMSSRYKGNTVGTKDYEYYFIDFSDSGLIHLLNHNLSF